MKFLARIASSDLGFQLKFSEIKKIYRYAEKIKYHCNNSP